jgi:CopG family transcriptional regulator, nickel-responsive regulator
MIVLFSKFPGEAILFEGVTMGVLSRIGVALDSDLLERFDSFISRLGYTNRSEAFRDLIRDRLVAERTSNPNAMVVGTVTLIYDHHAYGVTEKLTEIQHANHKLVVSTSHAHLDHDSCLEVLIVHGKSGPVEEFAGRLIGLKGVQHGRLVMTVAKPISGNHLHAKEKSHTHKH